MMKYRVAVALMCGAAFTSLVVLLMNAPTPLVLLLSPALIPGTAFVSLFLRLGGFGPPLLVLAANTIFYAAAAYAAIWIFRDRVSLMGLRRAAVFLAVPMAALTGLACTPRFNPFWPQHMAELSTQEQKLQAALSVGLGIDHARDILRSKGIEFQERTQTSSDLVPQSRYGNVKANAGDDVISARFQTDAFVFPCGCQMELMLVFGPDGKLRQQYVHRLRICP
jgi:hypothetical protein